jgi:hypothetical protein
VKLQKPSVVHGRTTPIVCDGHVTTYDRGAEI